MITKLLPTSFILLITAVMTVSCVPKATEKKAVCGANQAFDSVSRSCYSIAEIRYKPVATKATESLVQETSKVVTLSYSDKNSDQAVSCSVTGVSSNMEVMSPLIVDGGLFTSALEVYDSANDLGTAIANVATVTPADVTTATNAQTAMLTALTTAQQTYVYSKILTQIGVLKTQVNILLTLAMNYPADTSTVFFKNLTTTRLAQFDTVSTFVQDRCACSGGVCTTTLIPKINQTGTAGFTYTITDADGESNPKAVTTTISAMPATTAHLKPVAESSYEIFTESTSSTASSYALTLPGAADLFGTTSFTYAFNGSKNGSNQGLTSAGKVWGCMDLTGSSGLTDKTCLYSPNDGNAFDSAAVAYSQAIIGDLTYDSLTPGTFGNSITVRYYNIQNNLSSVDSYLTKTQLFGMVSTTYNESFIRVDGNAIKVFINPGLTSSEDIRDMINAHPQAMKLVSVSGGGAATFPVPSVATPAAVALAGGVDAFDTIPFTVSNGSASSANTSKVLVKINSADDAPVMNFVATTSTTVLEDTDPINFALTATFSDVDTDGVTYTNVCNVDPLDAVFLANFTVNSCTCVAAACTIDITPDADVSSTTAFTFAYRIGSFDGVTTQYTSYRNYSLTLTPVNDAPQISSVALPVITAIPDDTIAESTSTVPNSDFVDIYVGPGGSGFETSQTLTLTAASSNTTLIPDANLVVTTPSAGVRRLTYTPVVNKSGTANITVTLKDNGGTANSGDEDSTDVFQLTVTMVNDPPAFSSPLSTVNTNEGGVVQTDGFYVDEDLGSSTDENAEGIRLTFTTDNATVLPTSAISIFYDLNDNGIYDSGEERAHGAVLETAAALDSKLHKVYLKLNPINGVAGNANIIVSASDGVAAAKTMPFALVVHPIASIHGGWANLSANGIKTDKTGRPVSESEIQCNYNKVTDTKKCGTAACTGTAAPNGTVLPDESNTIYYDSANKKCYVSTGSNAFSWVELRTTCPISRTAGVQSDNNYITSAVPGTPDFVGQYHFNIATETCSVSTSVSPATWVTYVPSKVTLSWNPFTISGSGAESGVQIAGWNVYRRERNIDYNFKGGHLQNASSTATFTITDPSVRTFTDTTAIAGKIYYYQVRPVDNRRSLPTYTPEIFSEIRVVAPQPNTTFVHRWMINQEICNGMNMTTSTTNKVDPTNNFRCPYYGPGATGGFYDYGQDLLVDSFELSCPYAAAPKCSADGCVGIGTPTSTTGVVTNDLYYDRSIGACFVYTGAAWEELQDTTTPESSAMLAVRNLTTALNAPLARVKRDKAVVMCSGRPDVDANYELSGALTATLPSKKDYMAYSAHPLSITDSEISDLEQGFSLNIASRCNGSAASGLEGAYTDSNIPSTSFAYTLPGTASSPIRSLVTGSIPLSASKSTESCVSRYGIQDIYGNVAEWTTDEMMCAAANFQCTSVAGSSYQAYLWEDGSSYGFNLKTGPFNDQDADGLVSAGDAYLTDWTFADEMFNAGKFSFPTAMPIDINIASNALTDGSTAIPYLLDIGPSSGITSSKLHDDGFIVNGTDTAADPTDRGGFAVGGSYLSGARSGRFTSELVPNDIMGPDLGVRCITPVPKARYPADSIHPYNAIY